MPITPPELARRIKAAREAAGLSQDEVARELKIPRSAVAQLEGANRRVSSLELERFSYLVGRSVGDFIQESFDEQSALAALFRLDPSVAHDDAVLAEVRRGLAIGREFSNLERLLGIDRLRSSGVRQTTPPPAAPWEAVQQGEQAADDERRRLGLGHAPVRNLTELVEGEGVRTATVVLPEEISGFTLHDPASGACVFVNGEHHPVRRRFSMAHEYAHVLLDRDQRGVVSRVEQGAQLREVRANAFAAAFLMPEEGLRQALERLGKPTPRRAQAPVFGTGDGAGAEIKFPATQPDLQVHDLALLVVDFGVSVPALVYRLFNLGLLSKPALEEWKSRSEEVRRLVHALKLEERWEAEDVEGFKERFFGLALEAHRRHLISLGKAREVGELVGLEGNEVEEILQNAGLEPPPVDVLHPGSGERP